MALTNYLNRSMVGNLRDGVERVAEAIHRRLSKVSNSHETAVLMLANGNVYAIDPLSATFDRVVKADPNSLIATYKLKNRPRKQHGAPGSAKAVAAPTVSIADIVSDLRAGALGMGWIA